MTRPKILERLRGVQRAGDGWLAFCPHHPDHVKQSLSVTVTEDGRQLVHCFVGCPTEKVVAAVGMTMQDLAPPTSGPRQPPRREVAVYDYHDEAGRLLYQVVRFEPKDFRCRRPDGRGGWTWNLDSVRVVPYHLHELAEARRVYIAEGEQDCDALAALGLTATTNHGGAGKWRGTHTQELVATAVPEVIVLRDNDRPGAAHQESVARSCAAAGLRVKRIELPGLPPLREKHGEDVSVWLAAGHTAAELEALAEAAPILTLADAARSAEAPEAEADREARARAPELHREGDDLRLTWPADGVSLRFDHLQDGRGLAGDLTVEADGRVLHWGRLYLANTRDREELVRKLDRLDRARPWRALLDQACRRVAEEIRQGAPTVRLSPTPAPGARLLVEPLLPLGETAVIFGDGGAGKSVLALALGVAVSTGCPLPGGLRVVGSPCPVLLLDWESCEEEQADRLAGLLAGLGVARAEIYYRPMVRPLAEEAHRIRAEIARLGIGGVVVDSLGPALGAEPEGADAAIRALNALRSFAPATRLVLAHVSKAEANRRTGASRPYGSVYVQNLARSVWEVRRAEDDDEALTIALYHRKVNRGRLHRPLGLRFEFPGDMIRFRGHDLSDEPDLLARTSLSLQILKALVTGAQTVAEVADTVSAPEKSAGRVLRRLREKGKVIRLDDANGKGRWGLSRS